MCNMKRIVLTVSEEMSYENVDGQTTDGRRTPDTCIYFKLTMSLRLRVGSGELRIRVGRSENLFFFLSYLYLLETHLHF